MTETVVDLLYHDPALVQFYDLENDWAADQDYCVGLAARAGSVLDLGCGTGRLVASLASRCDAVGVDPAAAMLDVARTRPGGDRATWCEGDARTVRLNRRFDLVVLTGHAFQVFLTPEDQRAVLATIAVHLAPGGHFIFDTRNPAAGEWQEWTPALSRRRLRHPGLGEIEAWNDVAYDTASGVATYHTFYRIIDSGRELAAASRIAFTPQETLAAMIDGAGLTVHQWLGDWGGGAYGPDSAEIIPLGGPA